MVVRLLQPTEAEAYAALRREMLADAPWAFSSDPSHDQKAQAQSVRAGLELAAREPGGAGTHLHVVSEGDRLVAAAGLWRESTVKRRHVAGIWGVYVTPAARGRGLARRVVAAAIETARTWEGVRSVQLSVSANSPAARHVYESLGFVAWGREPGALLVDGVLYDEVHMARAL